MKYLICLFFIFSCQQKPEQEPQQEASPTPSTTQSSDNYFHKTLRDCLDGQIERKICYETLDFHLANGANINGPDTSMLGLPPLHWAVMSKNLEMVEYLVKKGVGVNAKSTGKVFPVLTALGFIKHHEDKGQKGYEKITSILIKNGAR